LGSGGHLQGLRRTEAAGLRVEDARAPDVLQELATNGRLAEAILPVASLLSLPRIELDLSSATRFVHGSTVEVRDTAASGKMVAFAGERLLGVGTMVAGHLKPDKVLASEPGA
jgi:tRNA pseudouridine55 synthase